jgi:hypothetical protein
MIYIWLIFIDINECALSSVNENVCPTQTTTCVNLTGSYSCECLPGYTKNNASVNKNRNKKIYFDKILFFLKSTAACVDINECTTNTSTCSQYKNSYCVNLTPFYECRCDYGYAPDGNKLCFCFKKR